MYVMNKRYINWNIFTDINDWKTLYLKLINVGFIDVDMAYKKILSQIGARIEEWY